MLNGIVIEGAENTGKTTLCTKLMSKIRIPYLHMSRESGFKKGKFDYVNGYLDKVKEHNKGCIFDRYYVSELVYGRVRGIENITKDMQEQIESFLRERRYFVVLLDTERIPWDGKRLHSISYEVNICIKELFREVFETLNIDKMILDPVNNDSLNKVYEKWLMNSKVLYRAISMH